MFRGAVLAGAILGLGACATTAPPSAPDAAVAPINDPGLDALTSKRIETFRNDAEFVAYLKAAKAAAEARGSWWARGPVRLAQADIPCEPGEPCEDQQIVVTGAKISAAPASITNTQMAGVDEGDIVKNVGRFLIVLQDGRLFSVDTGSAVGEMRLVDRANVYRDPASDAWYDEMVVQGERIVVLGYSYDQESSEIAVFRISAAGALGHEATYYIAADDYYDRDNYATRLVGDDLVIYTPLFLSDIDPGEPLKWPLARRWIKEEGGGRISPGVELYGARNIYRPIQRTINPVVHAVSVCPLTAQSGPEFDCRTTALIGPDSREFYVSRRDVYLWLSAPYEDVLVKETPCAADFAPGFEDSSPGALFRLPLKRVAPSAVRIRGYPKNQFSLDATETRFRALLDWVTSGCDDTESPRSFRFLNFPLTSFSTTPRAVGARRYAMVPALRERHYENRFTDDYVVYGGRPNWGAHAPKESDGDVRLRADVVAVPADAPGRAVRLSVPHSVIRAERAGDDIVLTGYRDSEGLGVSVVKLDGAPRIGDTEFLLGRYESEGRSHAFNSRIGPDGAGLIGLPTVALVRESMRWVFRSDASDVSFLSVSAAGDLRAAGVLEGSDDSEDPAYECEVSCVDWYGNTRPIFLGSRIFGLSGAELIEGVLEGGSVREAGRLNITAPR